MFRTVRQMRGIYRRRRSNPLGAQPCHSRRVPSPADRSKWAVEDRGEVAEAARLAQFLPGRRERWARAFPGDLSAVEPALGSRRDRRGHDDGWHPHGCVPRALRRLDRLDVVEAGIDRHCRGYRCARRGCNVFVPEFLVRCRRTGGDRKRRCRVSCSGRRYLLRNCRPRAVHEKGRQKRGIQSCR